MNDRTDESLMGEALEACARGVDRGQTPFGACIVHGGEIVATAHNEVWARTDPTAHAEILCIREACRRAGSIHLDGATIYSTTEPCPMCFAAIHWTRIARIVYGARIADAQSYGFHELPVATAWLNEAGGSGIRLMGDCRREDAVALFRRWQQGAGRPY